MPAHTASSPRSQPASQTLIQARTGGGAGARPSPHCSTPRHHTQLPWEQAACWSGAAAFAYSWYDETTAAAAAGSSGAAGSGQRAFTEAAATPLEAAEALPACSAGAAPPLRSRRCWHRGAGVAGAVFSQGSARAQPRAAAAAEGLGGAGMMCGQQQVKAGGRLAARRLGHQAGWGGKSPGLRAGGRTSACVLAETSLLP